MSQEVPDLEVPVDDSAGLEEVPELITFDSVRTEKLPFDIALIIDGVVYAIHNTDGQGAAQLLSQPTFVRVTDSRVRPGDLYIDGTFQPQS
jgi:hypothetical protein